jgi:type II secretory pathway component PulC
MNAASWLEGLPAPEKWRTLLITHGPRIATWALAVLLAIQAAVIVTGLGGASRSKTSGARPVAPAAPRHVVDISSIINAHIFKVPEAPSLSDRDHAPATSLPLVLTGILAADDPQHGLAILGQSAQSTNVFAVGDHVPGGAKLHSVLTDRVVIDRGGGRLETLLLPHKMPAGSAPPPTTSVLNTDSPIGV